MKKLKAKNMSPAAALIVAAAAILFAVPIRTFQLVNLIDAQTGFWLAKDKTVPVLYALVIAAVVAVFVLAGISGIMPKPKFSVKRDIPLGIASCFTALALLLETYTVVSALQVEYTNLNFAENVYSQIAAEGMIIEGFEALFALLSAIYFIFVAVSKLTASDAYERRRILALSPTLWMICRLLMHFLDPISYRNVSFLLFEIAFLIFALIFMFSFARIAGGVNAEKSIWVLLSTGLSTVILGCVISLAPLVVTLTGRGAYLNDAYPAHFADLTIAVFALLVVYNVLPRTADANSLDELEEEPAPEVPEELENPKEHAKDQRRAEKAEKKAAKAAEKAEKAKAKEAEKAAKKAAKAAEAAEAAQKAAEEAVQKAADEAAKAAETAEEAETETASSESAAESDDVSTADIAEAADSTAESGSEAPAEEHVKTQHEIELEEALERAKANAEAAAAQRHRSVYIQDGPYKADAPAPTVYEED